MSLESVWQEVPRLPSGEFDFEKIKDKTIDDFWSALSKKISLSPELLAQLEKNDDRLFQALQAWVNGTVYNDKEALVADFLYGGDPSLEKAFSVRYAPGKQGLSVKLVRNMLNMQSLRSLFYYYQRHYSEYGNKTHDKYRFVHILIENVRALLKDVCDNDTARFCGQPIGDKKAFYLLENLFYDYEKLKTPARKIRLNRLLKEQQTLPEFKKIREKVEVLKSISEHSVNVHSEAAAKDKGTKLSDLLCDTFTPVWDKHMNGGHLEVEHNGERINFEISNLLDNLTFGELRDSEKMKNRESGEKGRAIRRDLSLTDSGDQEKVSNAMMRLRLLRSVHESLDALDENGRSGYDKLDCWEECGVYCPEDVSDKVWERLSKNEKAFLYTISVCKELPSCTGFKGILQNLLDCKISYMDKNIRRIILECLLSISLPEIKGSNQTMVLQLMKRLTNENDCETDINFNIELLCNCSQRDYGRTDLQELEEISEIANTVYQQLACGAAREE